MATQLHRVKIAPKGMGLNDFVAMQEGYFAAEGLEVEFDWKTFRGTRNRAGRVSTICNARRIVPTHKINPT